MTVEASAVVVALVVVAFLAVKFCKVVEPTTKRSPLVLKVEVARPPKRALVKTAKFVEVAEVEVASVVRSPPLKVARPEAESVVSDAAPAVKALAPMLMAPNEPPIEPEARMPTPVSDELTTALPKVVAFKTLAPSIL